MFKSCRRLERQMDILKSVSKDVFIIKLQMWLGTNKGSVLHTYLYSLPIFLLGSYQNPMSQVVKADAVLMPCTLLGWKLLPTMLCHTSSSFTSRLCKCFRHKRSIHFYHFSSDQKLLVWPQCCKENWCDYHSFEEKVKKAKLILYNMVWVSCLLNLSDFFF